MAHPKILMITILAIFLIGCSNKKMEKLEVIAKIMDVTSEKCLDRVRKERRHYDEVSSCIRLGELATIYFDNYPQGYSNNNSIEGFTYYFTRAQRNAWAAVAFSNAFHRNSPVIQIW